MALKKNTFEGGTNGTTFSFGSSGGASGDAFQAAPLNAGDTFQWSSAQKAHGNLSLLISGSGPTHADYTGYAATSMAVRFYVRFGSLPATSIRLMDVRTNTVSVARVSVDGSNRFVFQTNNGTTTSYTSSAVAANTWYRVEVACTNGTSGATLKFDYYALDSGSPVEAGYTTAAGNTGTTANITQVFFGSAATTSYAGNLWIDDTAVNDGTTTYIGAAGTPPTAAFTLSTNGLTISGDGTTSSFVAPATSLTTYSWDWGDGNNSTGSTANHTYAAAGNYTVVLTVTDNNGLASPSPGYVVQMTAAAGVNGAAIVYLPGGWSMVPASGMTEQAILNDNDGTTWLQTPNNPSASAITIALQKLTFTPGQAIIIAALIDRIGGTTGSFTADLKEGATTRSSLTGLTPAVGTAGASLTNLMSMTFPPAECAAITDPGNLRAVLTFTGS